MKKKCEIKWGLLKKKNEVVKHFYHRSSTFLLNCHHSINGHRAEMAHFPLVVFDDVSSYCYGVVKIRSAASEKLHLFERFILFGYVCSSDPRYFYFLAENGQVVLCEQKK